MRVQRCILAIAIALASVQLGFAEDSTPEQKAAQKRRNAFLQTNFTNFARISFLPPTNKTETVIQRFKVSERLVGTFEGVTYSGVRVTVPDWVDGDLHWVFFHLNAAAERRQRVGVWWSIVPERGEAVAPDTLKIDPDESVEFWRRYPYTGRAYSVRLARTNLHAGQTYALFVGHFAPDPPDIAFAVTIDSERGRTAFGSPAFISGREITAQTNESSLANFLKQNFTNFPAVNFLPPTNKAEATIQHFNAVNNEVGTFESLPYTGVRVTLPNWLDGDLQLIVFHLNPEERMRQRVNMMWGIAPASGDPVLLGNGMRLDPDDTLAFWHRFPFTRRVYSVTVPRAFLNPGRDYALYFGHLEPDPPDVAFALSIDSERGRKEFGSLKFVGNRQGFAGQNPASPRTVFLRQHFTNFAEVKFLPVTNETRTTIQSFNPFNEEIGSLDNVPYSGVRFTLPEWFDGDLKWVFFHLNPEEQKRQPVGLSWGMVSSSGQTVIIDPLRIDPDDALEFWKSFPNTRRVYSHIVPRSFLKGGQSYAFHFAHSRPEPPDVAFAMTINSPRGKKEFGSLDFISGPEGVSSQEAVSSRTAFIQENFASFPLIKFLPPTNGAETALQRLDVKRQIVGELDGQHYAGIRFTTPEWMDGDIELAFFHLYRPQDVPRNWGLFWGIEAENGKMPNIRNVTRKPFEDLPEMAERFKTTDKAYVSTLPRAELRPGRTYVLWWAYTQADLPDLLFGLTIKSDRGRKEFGSLTWR